jgi:pimeloyl-ACP methyl ester carboxylesterase
MRVEKTGVGDSQGPSCESERADLQSEVKGYVEGLRALRNYDFVDAENVFLVGLSIGGVEAPLVAQQASVKGIVVINTVARSFLDDLQDIRRTQGALRKIPYDVLESNLRINARCNYELFVEHKPVETLLDNEPACGEWVRYPAPRAFMQQWAELNPAAQWKDVSVPVLILHGEYDFIASAVDGSYLRDIVESFHAGMATQLSMPKMDHYMAHVTSWSESLDKISGMLGEFESSLIDIVGGWLQGHSG